MIFLEFTIRPIPKKLRDILASDPFMKRCLYDNKNCNGSVQWHHNFIHAGRQINETWAIVPLCAHHHNRIKTDKSVVNTVCMLRSDGRFADYPSDYLRNQYQKTQKNKSFIPERIRGMIETEKQYLSEVQK